MKLKLFYVGNIKYRDRNATFVAIFLPNFLKPKKCIVVSRKY